MSDVGTCAVDLLSTGTALLVLGASLGAILMWAALRRRWALLFACLSASAAATILYQSHAPMPVLAGDIVLTGLAAPA